jgi:hypothetical protein
MGQNRRDGCAIIDWWTAGQWDNSEGYFRGWCLGVPQSTELSTVPWVSSALSFIGGVHFGARALHVLNLIWFGYIARLSQWGGGNLLVQMISTCRPSRRGRGGGRHPVGWAESAVGRYMGYGTVLAMKGKHRTRSGAGSASWPDETGVQQELAQYKEMSTPAVLRLTDSWQLSIVK